MVTVTFLHHVWVARIGTLITMHGDRQFHPETTMPCYTAGDVPFPRGRWSPFEAILSLSENPLVLLFLINILLFIVGMFLDAGPAIIILGPILGPIFVEMGVHPVHFAIIMSVNLTVGLATPPMGLVLFVASSVSGEKVETIAKAILPFLAVEIFVIFLITYVPAISMTIPRLTGFVTP